MTTPVEKFAAMSQRFSLMLCTLVNLLIPIAVLVFATGFFPYKPFIPGRATSQGSKNGSEPASAPFDKVIFMVVDALRRLTPVQHQRQSIALRLSVTSFILIIQASNIPKRELSMPHISLCTLSESLFQTHNIRGGHTFHRPCNLTYHHHAQSQSNYYRIHPLVPRCHPEFCGIRHEFQPCKSRYLAWSNKGQARRKAGNVWGRYLAEAVSRYIHSSRGYFKLFRIGQ